MARIELKREPASPGRARNFVRRILTEWGVDSAVADDAELLVTELVTNAVIHARSSVSLDMRKGDEFISFSITDRGPGSIELRTPSPESVTGRGIYLLDQIANDWEVLDKPGRGKTIRFELAMTPSATVSSHGR